ncbi:hypothetical protein KDA82_33045 [Streptomyces daliensis]|uniref:Uncharacterized protein n=1 Tax=Streptomyces daliensis TaxID=299421 RepID=A0A8T4J332_9ACTN|nr:hypothetical protein [Streptomyces daliensis]
MSTPATASADPGRSRDGSRALPPYRGIVAVDAKDFTGYPAVEHGTISRIIPQLLQESFRRAGLGEVWDNRRFPNSTGDGYVFGFDPAAMPFVIHPWTHTLQQVLTEFNVHSTGAVRIRLRVSLHIGPLPDSGDAYGGNGTPRNDTHRLLDSRPVKAILASSSENVTQVAAILSDRCYQDVVAGGYTGRHRDYFIEVPATVEGKQFEQRAWLYVPVPSGSLYDRRILGEHVIEDQEAPSRQDDDGQRSNGPSPGSVTVHRADRGIVNTGSVDGGQHLNNFDMQGDYVGGSKAGTVHGGQGDTVHGDKNGGGR